MEVRLAKSAGFCFGVKKAMEKVYEQIENAEGKKIYTYGPIIHNEEVVKELKSKGVEVVDSVEELKALKKGIVIIRSHGVSKDIYKIMEAFIVPVTIQRIISISQFEFFIIAAISIDLLCWLV